MKSSLCLSTVLVATFVLSSCDTVDVVQPNTESVLLLPFEEVARKAVSLEVVELSNFVVSFDGRTYDASSNTTTFAYTVAGSGVEPDLTHFIIGLPECAPEASSYTPVNGVRFNVDPFAGFFGINWHVPVSTTASQAYTVTFPGDVPAGAVDVAVRRADLGEVGRILGPCGDAFAVSGTVFSDADADGIRDDSESGFDATTVSLTSAAGSVTKQTTALDGTYRFEELAPGDYTIDIAAATDEDDINETLSSVFTYTGGDAPSLTVTVGPDSEGNDFGFEPNAETIVQRIEEGAYESEAETVSWWIKQINSLVKGKEAEFDAPTLQVYLDGVESLLVVEPFQLDDADEFGAALDILAPLHDDAIEELKEELLAAELNHVSGKGVSNVPGMQLALLAWGEAIVVQNAEAASAAAKFLSDEDIDRAIDVFGTLNSGGGLRLQPTP